MKKKNRQFENNISRLVKQAETDNSPSQAFKEQLIEDALKELKTPSDHSRERKDRTMKANWMKTAVSIAAVLVVGAVIFSIIMPRLGRVRRSTLLSKNMPVEAEEVFTTNDGSERAPSSSAKPESTVGLESVSLKVKKDLDGKVTVSASDDLSKIPYLATERGLAEMKEHPDLDKAKAKYVGTPVPVRDRNRFYYEVPQQRLGDMAHGGTTPPNGEPVDAMFFKNYGVNPFVDTEDDHLSTFATDVDTGSYTIARRYLLEGHLPPREAVRVEEFVNYFDYRYPAPQKDTFAVYTEAFPWSFGSGRKNSYLMKVALKAKQISEQNRKPAILTFVIDVSGSMGRENRLGLVKKSLRLLLDKLKTNDKIGIAVYGSNGRKVMDHKGLDQKAEIIAAIEGLHTDGSTNAEEGIRIGYQMADEAFKPGHINRVILCSDGVANVGRTGPDDIFKMIKQKADKGITLSALGFGMGNYNDVLMERLGDKGNGYYAYIDTIAEARKLFSNLTGALEVVARDVKIQVDFNPDVVRSYRLIGYENRDVADVDFRNDTVDGGEMGAGHSATALYELKLWPDKKGTIATTYVRYKHPETFEVTEFKSSFGTDAIKKDYASINSSFALAATVAEFAEILRESYWAKEADLSMVLEKAQTLNQSFSSNTDVVELVNLIAKASQINTDKESNEEPAEIEYLEKDE